MLFLLFVEEPQLHPVNMFYVYRQDDNNILNKCVLLELSANRVSVGLRGRATGVVVGFPRFKTPEVKSCGSSGAKNHPKTAFCKSILPGRRCDI